MEVAKWFIVAMGAVVLAAWIEEQWKVGTWVNNQFQNLLERTWCAMMRHTGDPIYRYRARH